MTAKADQARMGAEALTQIATLQRELAEAKAKLQYVHAQLDPFVQDDNRPTEALVRSVAKQLAHAQSWQVVATEAMRVADDAMTWDLGGEPLPTLMASAREKIRATLAGQPAPKGGSHG